MSDFNQQLVEEFRANDGKVAGTFAESPLLVLTTTGAKSGQPRTVPLVYTTGRRPRCPVSPSTSATPPGASPSSSWSASPNPCHSWLRRGHDGAQRAPGCAPGDSSTSPSQAQEE